MNFSCHSDGVQIIKNVYGWNFFPSVEADVVDLNVFNVFGYSTVFKTFVGYSDRRKGS